MDGYLNPDSVVVAVIGDPSYDPAASVKDQVEQAGRDYRRAHPERLKETLEVFGYVATEAEGIWWTDGFWSIWPVEGTAAGVWPDGKPRRLQHQSVRVRVTGSRVHPAGMDTWG